MKGWFRIVIKKRCVIMIPAQFSQILAYRNPLEKDQTYVFILLSIVLILLIAYIVFYNLTNESLYFNFNFNKIN